ncbi:DUF4843 domain-containing protein [Paraflavitalea sp. CAU 1676]|uniref:DUF4843 domain-containing protein n=1 Tax=Paraflavitalea sp. CAU 1676 TaxID=3032598 RepID=UPI0023DA3B24|nr:DUF4843 domain-containing protein [Paraflavitalea sp. CAU 1676]MDF2192828.1 DUF4843 domain-containing protein [Paraflavitalea sp. CAU 1676]
MKKLLFISILAGVLAGCEKDIKTFDGKPDVYFQYASQPRQSFNTILVDSTIVSFAYASAAYKDSVLVVPIKVSGLVMDYDRPYLIKANDSSTAKAGVHYEIINSDFTIGAGKISDTVYLKLKRIPEMLTQSFNIYLELHPNENFGVGLEKKLASANKYVSTIRHRVMVDDILKKPMYWIDGYLGVFSRKKLYLMSEQLDIPIDKLNTTVSVAEVNYYGKFMQRYLNEQKTLGNIIKEDDGTDMIMGSAVQ